MFLRRTVRFRRLEVVALRFRGAEFLRFAAGLVRLRCAGFRLAFMARFAAFRCAFEPKWSFCLRLSFRATLAFLPARFRAGFAMIVRTVETAIQPPSFLPLREVWFRFVPLRWAARPAGPVPPSPQALPLAP